MAARRPFSLDVDLGPADLGELFTPFQVNGASSTASGASRTARSTSPFDRTEPPSAYPFGAPFEPIDWDYLYALRDGPIIDVVDHYFRGRLIGTDKLPDPDDGPCIVAPNHSGNAFPHDAIVLDTMLWRDSGYTKAGKFRSVYTPQLAATWWMRPFAIDDWWRRVGGVDMTYTNFDCLLDRGDRIIYYPEGVPGIGKGFTRRYQLQPYSPSFVLLAIRHGAPIYPVSVVNAEWVNPTSITFEAVDRLFRKGLGLPFLPLPIAPLALLFPFVFYLAFPCKMRFVIQDPIDARAVLREEGCTDWQNPDREAVRRATERIQQRCQLQLNDAVRRYGQAPYDWSGLFRAMGRIAGRILRTTPLGWPVAYVQHERDLHRDPPRNRWHAFLRDLDLAAWYLPLGWFLIAALRTLRTPPYGHLGLSDAECRRAEGSYRWSLKDHPLPYSYDDA